MFRPARSSDACVMKEHTHRSVKEEAMSLNVNMIVNRRVQIGTINVILYGIMYENPMSYHIV